LKRQVEGLLWAKRKPTHTVKIRNSSEYSKAQYLGIRFEKAFCEYLGAKRDGVHIGPWLEFEDVNGWGLCQPDAVLLDPFIIFECKLTFKKAAFTEMSRLYRPVCERWLNLDKPKMVQVCKFLKPDAKNVELVFDLKEVIECKRKRMTWLWS